MYKSTNIENDKCTVSTINYGRPQKDFSERKFVVLSQFPQKGMFVSTLDVIESINFNLD